MYKCMCVHPMHAQCPKRPEEGVPSPGTGVANGCEPACGHWKLILGPLQEQHVILITEPSV